MPTGSSCHGKISFSGEVSLQNKGGKEGSRVTIPSVPEFDQSPSRNHYEGIQ